MAQTSKFPIILLLLGALGVTVSSNAQNTHLDSLWNVWEDETQADTARIMAIQNFIWDGFMYSQPDSAYYYSQLQYDFAISTNLKKSIALAINNLGASCLLRGDLTRALEYFEESRKINEEIGNKSGLAKALGNIGLVYNNRGDFLKALSYFKRSLALSEELGDKKTMAAYLNNIGQIYELQGDYPRGLHQYQRSLAYYKELGLKGKIAVVLSNIGNIYESQGEYTKALTYYQQSLNLEEEISSKLGMAGSLINMGVIYSQLGDSQLALDYYKRSLLISEETGDKRSMAVSLDNIGGVYEGSGEYYKAIDYKRRSLAISEELNDEWGIATSLINIGAVFLRTEDYKSALEYCNRGLKLSESIGLLSEQKEACRCLYNAHKELGSSNEALAYYEQMSHLDDSLRSNETNQKLQQMEFHTALLEDSIANAEAKRLVQESHNREIRKEQQTRNWSLAGGILFLILSAGLYNRWVYIRKSRDIITREKERSENLLHNILPEEVAAELKERGESEAKDFDEVTVLFTDFVGFTQTAEKLSAKDLVNEINTCFKEFDEIIHKYQIEKIKTIGDAYMAAGGLHVPRTSDPRDVVNAALEMQEFIEARHKIREAGGEPAFRMRVGIHTGPVVAGIVGVKKFQYDIWGDTVNTAARMESHGEIGKVNVSEATYELVKDDFKIERRETLHVKGKGDMTMYFISRS